MNRFSTLKYVLGMGGLLYIRDEFSRKETGFGGPLSLPEPMFPTERTLPDVQDGGTGILCSFTLGWRIPQKGSILQP